MRLVVLKPLGSSDYAMQKRSEVIFEVFFSPPVCGVIRIFIRNKCLVLRPTFCKPLRHEGSGNALKYPLFISSLLFEANPVSQSLFSTMCSLKKTRLTSVSAGMTAVTDYGRRLRSGPGAPFVFRAPPA